MSKVRIADFRININSGIKNFDKIYRDSLSDFSLADFEFCIEEKDVEYEKTTLLKKSEVKYETTCRRSAFLRILAENLSQNNSFLLHSVCVDIDGVGVAFSALSGTGKSTHLANWWRYLNGTENMPESLKNLLKDKETARAKDTTLPDLTIVNGDKPIVRFFDEEFCKEKGLEIPQGTEFGVPYAYGTPWCGKENLGCNMRTKLKHICFIERSETNFVTKIDKKEAVERIMKQVYMPKDPIALANTLKLVDRLINSCELWIIHCNMEPESAKTAYDAIFKNH